MSSWSKWLLQPSPVYVPVAMLALAQVHCCASLVLELFFRRRYQSDVVPVLMVLRSPLTWSGAYVIVEGSLRAKVALTTPITAKECVAWRVAMRRGRGMHWEPDEFLVQYADCAAGDKRLTLEDASGDTLSIHVRADGVVNWIPHRVDLHDAVAVGDMYAKLGIARDRATAEWDAGCRKWRFIEERAPVNRPCYISIQISRDIDGEVIAATPDGLAKSVMFEKHDVHLSRLTTRAHAFGYGLVATAALTVLYLGLRNRILKMTLE